MLKGNFKEELERKALDLIMQQQDAFTANFIIMVLRAEYDDNVSFEDVADVVINAIEFCLSEGYLDAFEGFRYKVDPIKQIEFNNKHEETASI